MTNSIYQKAIASISEVLVRTPSPAVVVDCLQECLVAITAGEKAEQLHQDLLCTFHPDIHEREKDIKYLQGWVFALERALKDAQLSSHRHRQRADKAEADYRFMVEKAADERLGGYRELGERAASAENRADQAEARVKELEMLFKRMTIVRDIGTNGDTIAIIDFPAIEKVLRSLPEPHQSAPGAESVQPVAPAAESSTANVAPPEPEAGVGAEVDDDPGQH